MTDRTTARLVGVLFIVASAAAIAGGLLALPVTSSPSVPPPGDVGVVSGVALELLWALSAIGIAALLFPVLRRHDEGLALSYVGARTVEAGLAVAAAVSALVILAVSHDPGAGSGQAGAVVAIAQVTREWTFLLAGEVAFAISAVILYSVLLRGRLLPQWLSAWGLIGGVALLTRGLCSLYGVALPVPAQVALTAPIAINEMVLAFWLIRWGFTSRASVAAARGRPATARI